MSSRWNSIQRHEGTDCLLDQKGQKIMERKDFPHSSDEELEIEVIKYALKNGFDVITVGPRKIWLKRSKGYTIQDIENQLTKNKTQLKAGKPEFKSYTVIHITSQ